MFKTLISNGGRTNLYYHKTDGGAEYLTNKYIITLSGTKEGFIEGATLIIRIDGGELEFITDYPSKDRASLDQTEEYIKRLHTSESLRDDI